MPRMTPIVIGWLSTEVVVDVFITSALMYFNLHDGGTHIQSPVTLAIVFSRSRTGVLKTDTVLNR